MPGQIDLFVFFGLIAGGKSTLAAAWAEKLGAGYYNSDRVRKELAGLQANAPQQESFNAGIYTPEFSRRTYARMLALAEEDLAAGKKVVLDGSYQAPEERALVIELAQRMARGLKFILCRCSENVTKQRLTIRAHDKEAVSDGRWEIYCQQKEHFTMSAELTSDNLLTLNTEGTVDELLGKLVHVSAP